ncbi:MAG: hypothetical protein IJQ67_04070 [Bacilli bacterium]|nr:hypothetical protein [Bacilli bacterium]
MTDDQYGFVYDFLHELAGLEPEKPYANNLIKGVRDLTRDTKDYILTTDAGKNKAAAFVRNWLIPNIQPLTLADYYEKIASVIRSDGSIADRTKNGLLKSYDDGKYEAFLLKSILYAISKENVENITEIPTDDMEFVFEADKKCSLCGKSLILPKAKKTMYRYSIVEIFPEMLSSSKKSEFATISREPADYLHRSNRICLCDVCADEYEYNPTKEVFRKLIDKKDYYMEKENASSALAKAKLDEEVGEILSRLREIKSFDELADFRKIPLELKEKIDNNETLRQTIKSDVEGYYNYIRHELSLLDDCGSEFKIIASQFQISYEKLKPIIGDQEDIYNRIINWVLDELKLPPKYSTAARIIVSFFVQNCEVFDEISK